MCDGAILRIAEDNIPQLKTGLQTVGARHGVTISCTPFDRLGGTSRRQLRVASGFSRQLEGQPQRQDDTFPRVTDRTCFETVCGCFCFESGRSRVYAPYDRYGCFYDQRVAV